MTLTAPILSSLSNVGYILAAMAIIALIEAMIPLRAFGEGSRAHLRPNLALTFITFGTNIVFNGALVAMLIGLQSYGFGALHWLPLQSWTHVVIVVLALDFSFYVAHVAMHKIPGFWRFHSVHHSDVIVDVTTTIRQHPGEGVIRYAFMALFAFALGASPGAFAVYRVWSAVNGLLEHANIRVPLWLDRALALVTTWPNMHKVHHSRTVTETDTNYGNIFSLWDRLFSTFTPAWRRTNIVYGLDGFDDPATQTTAALLAVPFRSVNVPSGTTVTARQVA